MEWTETVWELRYRGALIGRVRRRRNAYYAKWLAADESWRDLFFGTLQDAQETVESHAQEWIAAIGYKDGA